MAARLCVNRRNGISESAYALSSCLRRAGINPARTPATSTSTAVDSGGCPVVRAGYIPAPGNAYTWADHAAILSVIGGGAMSLIATLRLPLSVLSGASADGGCDMLTASVS